MRQQNLGYHVEYLVAKIKHYLISTMGRVIEEASSREIYQALSYALREEIMINWTATARNRIQNQARVLFYLSMEYLPGRILGNNITNLQSQEVIQGVFYKLGLDQQQILSYEPDPGLGNGGLGRLASCFLDSLATHNYSVVAYGLRYQYGIFQQQLWEGLQVERPDAWLLYDNPWEQRRDKSSFSVKYCGKVLPQKNLKGEEDLWLADFEEVRALGYDTPIIGYDKEHKYSVATMRLWTTKESPRNFRLQKFNAGQLDQAAENTTLTDVLYPCDHHETGRRIRLKQEFLLVSASLQDIMRNHIANYPDYSNFVDKVRIQINDTHPALVVAELIRLLLKIPQLSWGEAWEITRQCVSYTNHTVLAEALEEWDQSLMQYLLPRQYRIIERLNQELCSQVRGRWPGDEERIRRMSILENGKVIMPNLAIYGSHHVNGVAELHTEILKKTIFKDFYELSPEKFVNVTNGITQRRWLLHCNPRLAEFISKRIGAGWITDFRGIKELAQYASDRDTQEEFLDIKRFNKQRLIDFLEHSNDLRDASGEALRCYWHFNSDSLFDVQIKRIHEYKRQFINAIHLIMLYQELKDNPDSNRVPRTCIFGGKAAAGYENAKRIILLINAIAKKVNNDAELADKLKVVFVENYNVSRAEYIIPAAELSEQLSTAGMEASGTGNMKLAANGALTIGTEDGANVEMREQVGDKWWPFGFGASAEELESLKASQAYRAKNIYGDHPRIQRAVDALVDGTFCTTDYEREAFQGLYNILLDGDTADRFFVLYDLPSYYETQKKVDDLYRDPYRWAEYALHNIAGMGDFSADVSVFNYANKIWGLEPYPVDPQVLKKVRSDYSYELSNI
ncbi:MAG: glycogen/starch/alpha-glucan family phosphorylase [Chlamydiota bacterium]